MPSAKRMKYRRRRESGELVVGIPGRSLRKKNITTYKPGDELIVDQPYDLPGYPHQLDGWEFVELVETAEVSPSPVNSPSSPVKSPGKRKSLKNVETVV